MVASDRFPSNDASVNERFSLLASAVTGRNINVEKKQTRQAYSNGQVLYLPFSLPDDAIRLTIFAQTLLFSGDSFSTTILKRLTTRPRAIPRFMTLEIARMAQLRQDRLPRKYQRQIAELLPVEIPQSAEDSLARALSQEKIPALPQLFGTLKPGQLLRTLDFSPHAGSQLSDAINEAIENQLREDETDEEEKDDKSILLNLMALPTNAASSLSTAFKNIFGMGSPKESAGDKSGGTVDLSMGGSQLVDKLSSGASLIASKFGFDDKSPEFGDGSGFSYPEWDFTREQYKENWCQISHFEPLIAIDAHDIHETPDLMLRRQLAKLGMAFERYSRQIDGENLDISALVEYAVDKSQGMPASERVYETRRKTARDLGVVVLLDVSGSTQDHYSTGNSIWKEQRQLALKLIAALDEVGDCVAAYGFRSSGRHDVRFLRIKQFDKRFDLGARQRLLSLEPSGYTRLGAAIRHATHLVATEAGTSNQLLVVISDGFPYDIEYSEGYAENDVRHALGEAIDNGVGCVCLNVGSAADAEMLERVWGNVGHATLKKTSELGLYVEPLFRSAILRAQAGGHVQRKVRRNAPVHTAA